MSRVTLPPMPVGAIQNVTFDFTSQLAVGETISTKAVVASVYSGTDAAPTGIVSGSASASGSVVTQLITMVGRTVGNIYELMCTITTSVGQTLKISAYLAVVPDLP